MDGSADLLINAIVSGLLLGGFYAAVSVGIAISFGLLDIVNIAHPAFILLGSYAAFIGNTVFGIDPILAAVIALPFFYLLGMLAYQVYYVAFERRDDQSLRGLSFFFGLLFITEVVPGADLRRRLPHGAGGLHRAQHQSRPVRPAAAPAGAVPGGDGHGGRACRSSCRAPSSAAPSQAVAQDQGALRLMAANPVKIKRIAFGLSIATASLAGACLIIIQPVEPSIGREYIGRIFAIVVLGGLGSFPGMVIAAMTLGIAESLTATFFGPSWAPAVAFGILLDHPGGAAQWHPWSIRRPWPPRQACAGCRSPWC